MSLRPWLLMPLPEPEPEPVPAPEPEPEPDAEAEPRTFAPSSEAQDGTARRRAATARVQPTIRFMLGRPNTDAGPAQVPRVRRGWRDGRRAHPAPADVRVD